MCAHDPVYIATGPDVGAFVKKNDRWQIDTHLEIIFRRLSTPSLLQTLLLAMLGMAVTAVLLWLAKGVLFGLVGLLLWIAIVLLCIGAG